MWSELVQAFLGFARGTLAPLGRHHSKSPTPAYGDPSSEGKTAPLGRHHSKASHPRLQRPLIRGEDSPIGATS